LAIRQVGVCDDAFLWLFIVLFVNCKLVDILNCEFGSVEADFECTELP
jgi:hypothetical protein